jgi:hypothetical protein
MSAPDSFRMYKARGQPGCWYGYVNIELYGRPITLKIDAKHVGRGVDKHFEGTVKRHLKADQQTLPLDSPREQLTTLISEARVRQVDREIMQHVKPEEGFDDDDLPEEL